MNSIRNTHSLESSPELLAAEGRAELSRRKLEQSIDRLGSALTEATVELEHKAESALNEVEQTGHKLHGKLDGGVVQLERFLDDGKQKLDHAVSQADQLFSGVLNDVTAAVHEVQDKVGRVKQSVGEVAHQADQIVGRIEQVLSGVRKDLEQSSESILARAEKSTKLFRAQLSEGAGKITALIDRAERTLTSISDPAGFVTRNPRLGITTLLFGGILIGAFFPKLFGRASREALAARSGVPDQEEPKPFVHLAS